MPLHASDPTSPKLERTRLRLVAAVRSEIEASGGTFTTESAARRAGSSPATFYNHFPSKGAALTAAYEALMGELVEFVRGHLRIERALEMGLEPFVADWLLAVAAFFRTNSHVFRAAQATLPTSKGMRDVFREHETAAFECYRVFVSLGQAASLVRPGDTDAIAQVLMVTSEGWNHRSVLEMEANSPLHEELTRSVVRMLSKEE